ncbi:DUF4235 domain-containing protein [Catalinimonas alkaloidigena]|nr:DUF4235 domain-containing protein [Catalinimonas alkaloidigena]
MSTHEIAWGLAKAGTVALTSVVVHKLLDEAYAVIQKDHPPKNPDSPDTDWKEAVIWTISSAVLAGVTSVLMRRELARGWVKLTGSMPPGMEE